MKTTTTTLSTSTLAAILSPFVRAPQAETRMQALVSSATLSAMSLRDMGHMIADCGIESEETAEAVVGLLEKAADRDALARLGRSIQNPLKRARLDASLRTGR